MRYICYWVSGRDQPSCCVFLPGTRTGISPSSSFRLPRPMCSWYHCCCPAFPLFRFSLSFLFARVQ
jgi:hypothetical protein